MRLIDADAYLKKVCTYNETGCGSCDVQTICPVDEPMVDAVPIEFIRSEIKNSKGFYNSSLRRLLDAWAERKEHEID